MSTTYATVSSDLPHWDLTPIFPSLDSPQFTAAFAEVEATIAALTNLFDREGIAALPETPPVDAALIDRLQRVTQAVNQVIEQQRVLGSYLGAIISTDATDTVAQAKMSELRRVTIPLSILYTRHTAWLGSLPTEELIAASPVAADHAYYLREAKVYSEHLLTPAEEELTAQLSLAGGSAWTKLYNDYTSLITVPFALQEGAPETAVPMSVLRAQATDPNVSVRHRAYAAEIAAWERSALPLAAAMNAIKYEASVLSMRRGWGTPLDAAVFANHIERESLDAMLSAARKAFPDFRRYLRAKAQLLSGAEALPWWDLFAPLPGSETAWSWSKATAYVAEQFGIYSPKLRALAERAFRENWVDAEPRPGKRDGAYCISITGDISRIFQNYQPSFRDVSTLAHELGHAYHNLCLAHRTRLQRGIPMTLAETASIFCETIIRGPALAQASPTERLILLESTIQRSCQTVVDIHSRFLFEQRVFERRAERELSVEELCAIMREAQWETYGDGLDANALHPYMWAAKPHYYGSSFYNYPYMFGLLFSLGLYAEYQRQPDGFHDRYDDMLSRSGMATAQELAAEFGIDLRDEAFWTGSLAVVRADIDEFVALAEAQIAQARQG